MNSSNNNNRLETYIFHCDNGEDCDRLPKEVVRFPCLEILKSLPNKTVNNPA